MITWIQGITNSISNVPETKSVNKSIDRAFKKASSITNKYLHRREGKNPPCCDCSPYNIKKRSFKMQNQSQFLSHFGNIASFYFKIHLKGDILLEVL